LASSPKNFQVLTSMLIVAVVLAGCGGGFPGISPTLTLTPSPTSTTTPTATQSPTPTPLPPVGLLLIPPDAPPQLASEIQSRLAAWIPEMGYRFQVRQSISGDDLERDDFRMIIALPPSPEIASLAENHPETRFLTIGIQDLQSTSNLKTIGADGESLDQQGFVAGYMAAVITPDWRVGVIGRSDSERSLAARRAFITGVKFYCGLCLPAYPPGTNIPYFLIWERMRILSRGVQQPTL